MGVTAGVGGLWALFVMGVGSLQVYDVWWSRQAFMRAVRTPGTTHWIAPGTSLLLAAGVFVVLVFVPLTLAWLMLSFVLSSTLRGQSGRIYLIVSGLAVLAAIVLVETRPAQNPPRNLFHPALFTGAMDYSILLALDGLLALAASIWLWRRASR